MDTQTVQAMQNAAQGSQPQNNGTNSIASHLLPTEAAALAARKTVSTLLNPVEQPSAAPTDVTQMVDEIAQNSKNKEEIAKRVSAKLNPNGQPPLVESTPQPAEPVVMTAPTKEEADAQVVEPTASSDTVVSDDVEISPDAELNPKAEDFKKVRSALKKSVTTAKELLQQKTELETKLQKYDSGEELPPPVKDLKDKVARLEPYEHLLNLKTSDEYQETFVKPLQESTDKLKAIAADYGVPSDVMEKAAQITNRRDLNAFLLSHFDEVGALEAKEVISNIQKIRTNLAQAEAEPSKALERITQERLQLKLQEEAKRKSSIAETSKNSWASALLSIRNDKKIPEITPKDNDPEFNTKWVEPITRKASEEYGKFISYLGENGLKNLDPEFGKGLATTTVLATVASTALARADALEQELRELRANTERKNSMLRPNIGASRGGAASGAASSSRPSSPQETARALLRQQGVRI